MLRPTGCQGGRTSSPPDSEGDGAFALTWSFERASDAEDAERLMIELFRPKYNVNYMEGQRAARVLGLSVKSAAKVAQRYAPPSGDR
jgi:hypothetical protein